MSWRAESSFKASSKLTEDEKEYLKLCKKLRDVLKLEEKSKSGEALDATQQKKLESRDDMVKEVGRLAARLPGETELLDKNPDITELLPAGVRQGVRKARVENIEREKQEQQRRERRDEKEREERKRAEFMTSHDRPILSVCSDAEGRLYTGSKDKMVISWDTNSRQLMAAVTFAGHDGAVYCVDVSRPDAPVPSRLLSGGADGKILMWRTKVKGGQVASADSVTECGGSVRVLRWCPLDSGGDKMRFASASEKLGKTPASIAVWETGARGRAQRLLQITEIPTKANELQWSGGAKTKLISAHDNGYVGIWAAEGDGSLLKTIRLHSAPVSSLCLVADGTAIVTSSHDRTAKVVDISRPSTETLQTYQADRPLNCVCLSPDFVPGESGYLMVAGGRDPREVTTSKLQADEFEAKVIDAKTKEVVAAGQGHFGPVHTTSYVSWINMGRGGFATASEDGTVRVHDIDGTLLHSDTPQ